MVICSIDKNCNHYTKKLTFCPKYPNFWVKKAHFRPYRPIGASPINVFNTKKVSHWNPNMRVPKFLLPAPKNWILGPNLAQNWHFGPNIGIFGPFDLMSDQKTMRTSCRSGFLLCWYQKFLLTPIKIRIFGPKKGQIWSKICIFGHFWPNIAIFGTFYPMPNQKPL